jgi:mono/diheme cytochrome c family protein
MSHRPFAALTIAALLLSTVIACGGDKGASADAGASSASASAAQPASAGETNFQQRCMSCHQATGLGLPGVYPPLAGSEYANAANPGVPIRVLLHGLQGTIKVKGAEFNGVMPAYGVGITMSDEEVAAVLTYVRSSWGNTAGAVTAADVAKAREETKDHSGAMTPELLDQLISK